MSNETTTEDTWTRFCELNQRRRAIRDFDGAPLADEDVRAVLREALLAPSSGNLQPYELHWVRDAEQKRRVARACDAQRAALSASTLVVVVTGSRIGERTAATELRYVESSSALDDAAKTYHREQLRKFRTFLRIARLLLWAPLQIILALVHPVHSLLPFGPTGMRNWTARSGIFAAQALLLAAAARGLDSCPMEGFSAKRVAKILRLPRDLVIPVVIALGRRSATARIEPRWRRPYADAVVEH
jgi:nitroreductase